VRGAVANGAGTTAARVEHLICSRSCSRSRAGPPVPLPLAYGRYAPVDAALLDAGALMCVRACAVVNAVVLMYVIVVMFNTLTLAHHA
jgi:hypothetical protein